MWNSLSTFFASLDWVSVGTGVASLTLALVIKGLLDFKVALFFVKYLSFLPVRNVFREKPPNLKGNWEIEWSPGGSEKFKKDIDRHGHSELKQLGNYVYFEFFSQKIKYGFFGNIQSGYVVGDWFDIKDKTGYFGVYQLEIINAGELSGLWLGHSKTSREIRTDKLVCNRIKG